MNFPPSVVRLVLVKARFAVSQDAGASMHGAMFAASHEVEQSSPQARSELYVQARELLDQTEKLIVLDAAIASLPAPAEMGEGK